MSSKFKRVVLKITGEALGNKEKKEIFCPDKVAYLVNEIKSAHCETELAIVIGGGNVVRGRELIGPFKTTPFVADYIGMLATVQNGLLLEDYLKKTLVSARLLTAIHVNDVAEPSIIKRALSHLSKGSVVILAGGTGRPGVTTDNAAVLSAYELGADIVMKGTKVDGIYDKDPMKNLDAKFLPRLSYQEFLERGLTILDESAVGNAKMKNIPVLVFNIFKPGNLLRALRGEDVGSIIC